LVKEKVFFGTEGRAAKAGDEGLRETEREREEERRGEIELGGGLRLLRRVNKIFVLYLALVF
jgi:hypothetical protein